MKNYILFTLFIYSILFNLSTIECNGQEQASCQGFSVWTGIECDIEECGIYYQVFLTLNGFDVDGGTYTAIDNMTGDTTELSNPVLISRRIPVLRPYSFTVFPTGFAECAQTVEGAEGGCLDKGFAITDVLEIFFNDTVSYICAQDTLILDVLANDGCDPKNILSVSQNASTPFAQDNYDSAEVYLNDDNTITYIGNGDVSTDYISYTYEDYYGITRLGVVRINYEDTDPFEVFAEIVCDKVEGTTEVVITILMNIPDIDLYNFQYRNCDDENWLDLPDIFVSYNFDENGSALVLFEPFPSSFNLLCLEFRNLDIDCFTIENNVQLNCVTNAIELISFNGNKEGGVNLLDWATATEKDNDYFILEKSFDGILFHSIGRINAIGNNNVQQDYAFTDSGNINQNCYYRLIAVDEVGNEEIVSKVISIAARKNIIDLAVYPIPANEYLNLDFVSENKSFAKIEIIDATGKTVLDSQKAVSIGRNQIQLNVEELPEGVYLLKYMNGDDGVVVERFVK